MTEPCARCAACKRRPRVKVCAPVRLKDGLHWTDDLRQTTTVIYCTSCAAERGVGTSLAAYAGTRTRRKGG